MGWGFSHFKRCKSFSRPLVQPGILVGGGVLLTPEIILREDYLPCKFNIKVPLICKIIEGKKN